MLPIETVLAVFPPSAVACKVGLFKTLRLLPTTLAHCVAMDTLGCDLNGPLDEPHSLIAAWVLSKKPEELNAIVNGKESSTKEIVKFAKRLEPYVIRVKEVVNKHIISAFVTYVPGKRENNGNSIYSSGNKGFGWPLEIAECLCNAYGWDLDYALSIPMTRSLALLSVCRYRNGGENGGPDYYERQDIENLKRIGAFK